MQRFLAQMCAALMLSAALVVISPRHAAAFDITDTYPADYIPMPMMDCTPLPLLVPSKKGGGGQCGGGGGQEYDPSPTATYYMTNIGGYMVKDEPNPDDLMTKTQWGGGTVQKAGRIVVHTFGSRNFDTGGELNTVIAAYRGSSLSSLKLLAVNDDKAVQGFSTKQSLIQFDVAANTPYRIQFGGRNGAEGDIYATVSILPPGGGLSAFLATFDGVSFEGRDYICALGYAGWNFCAATKIIVHNSTNKMLTVTPTTSLGDAFINPAAFTLAPGKAKIVEFTYNSGIDKTTFRTVAGAFTFTGRVGTTVVSRAHVRGLVVVKSPTEAGPNVLRATVSRQVGTGLINNRIIFDVKLTNIGAQPAIGCHARSDIYSRLQTVWQELTPPSTVGAPNLPITIPAGGFKRLRVTVASQTPRDAAPDALGEIIIDCANTAELAFNAKNRFDLSALGSVKLRQVNIAAVAPTGDPLNVPASGLAKFRTSVTNTGAAAKMRVNGFYSGPFDDPANSQFTVTSVCEANADGACIGPKDGVLFYNAPKNVKKYFNVFVRAPSVNPGYDPKKRRVFLNIKQETPDTVSTDYVQVAIGSIAVKKQ